MSLTALRPRQATTSYACDTPQKRSTITTHDDESSPEKRSKLANVYNTLETDLGGYWSSTKPSRRNLGTETPGTKLAGDIGKLSMHDRKTPRRTASKKLMYSTNEMENDENIPPKGDTVGRRARTAPRNSAALGNVKCAPVKSKVNEGMYIRDGLFYDPVEHIVLLKMTEPGVYRSSGSPCVGQPYKPKDSRRTLNKEDVTSQLKKETRTPGRAAKTNGQIRTKKMFGAFTRDESSSSSSSSCESDDCNFEEERRKRYENITARGGGISSRTRLNSRSSSSSEGSSASHASDLSEQLQELENDFISVKTRGKPTGKPVGKRTKKVEVAPTYAKKIVKKKVQRKVKSLEDLRVFLHASEIPDYMPCRDEEFARIESFILDACDTSQAMYISGVPGTGKTATTKAVVNKLADRKDFVFIEVNAMELLDPKYVFVIIYNGVTGNTKRISPALALRKLNTMFSMVDYNRDPIVVLVDELDQLCTKKQEIIYDIFNWTSDPYARVSVISIANTLDLPERVLNQRISSRLGQNRIVFQPYEFGEIEEIVRDRLAKHGSAFISDDAIMFAARKVAAVSGDLRKALDILRRSLEIAVHSGDKRLEIKHVTEANREAASIPRVQLVCQLSRHAFLLFRAAVAQVHAGGVEEFRFSDLIRQYNVLCNQLEGIAAYFDLGVHAMAMEMCSNRLLVAASGNMMSRKFRLGMSTTDADFAIKHTLELIKNKQIKYDY